VVDLVLEKLGLHVLALERDFPTVEVITADVDLFRALDLEIETRHRKTAFFVLPFAFPVLDYRVDKLPWPTVADLVNKKPPADTYLRGCQADAMGFAHRNVHLLDQLRNAPVDVGDLVCATLQYGVTKSPDPVGSHPPHTKDKRRAQARPSERPALPGSSPGRLGRRMAEHYFTEEPSGASRPGVARLHLPDLDLELVTDRGVFSAERVDPGTLTLLKESPRPPDAGHLLDLGCGYAPIACTLAARAPLATVWAVDVNSRALSLAAANAGRLGLKNLRAVPPGEVPGDVGFAGIWSNPPIKVGKTALHALLGDWLPRLAPSAAAWLVVNKHLGSDTLAQWLREQGWEVLRVASKSGYRVLEVRRPGPRGSEGGDASEAVPSPGLERPRVGQVR